MFKEFKAAIADKGATKMLSGIVFLFISLFIFVAATPGDRRSRENGTGRGLAIHCGTIYVGCLHWYDYSLRE